MTERHELTMDERAKGARAAGAARSRNVSLRKALQALFDGKYKIDDISDGETISGADLLALRLFETAVNPESKNYAKAVQTIVKVMGFDKSDTEAALLKAQLELTKAKAKALEDEQW